MLHDYAIEPDLLASWDKCRLVLNLMGFQHGRAIAAYPTRKRWNKMVYEACKRAGCRDREFARIREKILQTRRKLVWVGSPERYDESITPEEERWICNATDRQMNEDAFHAILATRNPVNHRDVVLEDDVDENHEKLLVSREVQVPRQGEALVSHIQELVLNSRDLLFIDPHFDPSKYRWRPVMTACLRMASDRIGDRPLNTIVIHALDDDSKPSFEEYEARCRENMSSMLCPGLPPVRVCRWRLRDTAPEDFHERYVLTDRGGYWLGKGLDEEWGRVQPVTLLDDLAWERLWSGYTSETPFFEKDGEFTLP